MPFLHNKVPGGRAFLLFLIGQGISGLGDAFQFIAATTLLVKLAGSGLSAVGGIVYAALASIILAPFAGSIGDRFKEKNLLVLLDVLRGIVVILFISNHNIVELYGLILVLSCLDAFYNPPRRKLIANILTENELMKGNSVLIGVSGIAYILGPVLAGVMVSVWDADIAFFINSLSFFISAISIAVIKVGGVAKGNREGIYRGLKEGYKYYRSVYSIRELVITGTVAWFGITCMNIAFYPFAFDVLKVTSEGWGIMMSVFYGTNLVGMAVAMWLDKKFRGSPLFLIYFPLIITSMVWFSYGMVSNLPAVILLQFIEGTVLAVFSIVLGTRMQVLTRKAFMARVAGISDVIGGIARLGGIGITYGIMRFCPLKVVFMVNAVILFAFALFKLVGVRRVWALSRGRFL